MDRVAVFVDAGYLFGAGSTALAGSKQPRHLLQVKEDVAISLLRDLAKSVAGMPLLRVYWYDGVTPKGPTADHKRLAALSDVKLRLGFINSSGQQKGVDSLIVTDLVELARNHAMADAVVVAGDEDVRIGVQIAQNYGVRVHILGVGRSRSNQSPQLIQEADTAHEWSAEVIQKFLLVSPNLAASAADADITKPIEIVPEHSPPSRSLDQRSTIQDCAKEFAALLNAQDVEIIIETWEEYSRVPSQIYGRLLGTTRDRIGRMLEGNEKGILRSHFMAEVRLRRAG
ncbi:NYN domain-containing protein [Teichococcus aerofrigidensis]